MKRILSILSILLLMLLCLCGCNQQMMCPTEDVSGKQFYDISELRAFFVPHHMNYAMHTGELENMSQEQFMVKMLTYQEVDQHFPVEILKTDNPQGDYIMYPVCQGGFYYVFLSYFQPIELGEQTPKTTDYMYVVFTAYLGDADIHAEYSSADYYEIEQGVTTMSDIMELNPYAEAVFLSSGKYTCILLNNSKVLQIKYKYKPNNNVSNGVTPDSLVIVDATIKKIEDSVSLFAAILQ